MPHRKGYITRQAQRLTDGEINRRRFVMSALSAGVTMPTALSLASKAEAQTPKPGGTLRLTLAEGASPDATGADTSFTRLLAFARGNALTEITAEGHVIGELAEEFACACGSTEWRFVLRPDVSFQNGAPLTVEDATETLTRAAPFLPHMRDIRRTGPQSFNVTLAQPDPDFPRRLADPRFVITAADGSGQTTGPYRLEHIDETGRVWLTRNTAYWKPGRAHVDRVELRHVPDLSARIQDIMTGDADYADGIDPRALAMLHHTPEVALLNLPTGRHVALETTGLPPKTKDRIVAHIPDAEVVDRLLLGHGSPGLGERHMPPSGAIDAPALSLGVRDDGVPRSRDIARLIATRLTANGTPVDLIGEDDSRTPDLTLSWSRASENDTRLVLAWANDISAYRAPLTHAGEVATNTENDGARLIERWWFA